MTIVYQKGVLFKDTGKYFSKLREQLIKHLILNKSQLLCCNSLSDSYEDISQPYSKADVDSIVFAIKNRLPELILAVCIFILNNNLLRKNLFHCFQQDLKVEGLRDMGIHSGCQRMLDIF